MPDTENKIEEKQIEAKLAVGAVGIGEDHNKNNAREKIANLLRAMNEHNPSIVYLAIEFTQEEQKNVDQGIFIEWSSTKAEPKISQLAELAAKKGVKVICADDPIGRDPRRSAGKDGMTKRNRTICANITKCTESHAANDGKAKGILILLGADHFYKYDGCDEEEYKPIGDPDCYPELPWWNAADEEKENK